MISKGFAVSVLHRNAVWKLTGSIVFVQKFYPPVVQSLE
jgi:hypothetical protein